LIWQKTSLHSPSLVRVELARCPSLSMSSMTIASNNGLETIAGSFVATSSPPRSLISHMQKLRTIRNLSTTVYRTERFIPDGGVVMNCPLLRGSRAVPVPRARGRTNDRTMGTEHHRIQEIIWYWIEHLRKEKGGEAVKKTTTERAREGNEGICTQGVHAIWEGRIQ